MTDPAVSGTKALKQTSVSCKVSLRLSFRFSDLLDSGQDALDQIERVERWLQDLERTTSALYDATD